MNIEELLRALSNEEIIGEDPAVIDTMRYYSREAQKITMEVKRHEI